MSSQANQVALKKRLMELLKIPENQVCAECGKRGPKWASVVLGVFVCVECSALHKSLGTQLSGTRSVNLDSWSEEQVQFMEQWGNKRAREYYEATFPSYGVRPKETDSSSMIETFIRNKYEFKRYVTPGSPIPPARVTPTSAIDASFPVVVPPPTVISSTTGGPTTNAATRSATVSSSPARANGLTDPDPFGPLPTPSTLLHRQTSEDARFAPTVLPPNAPSSSGTIDPLEAALASVGSSHEKAEDNGNSSSTATISSSSQFKAMSRIQLECMLEQEITLRKEGQSKYETLLKNRDDYQNSQQTLTEKIQRLERDGKLLREKLELYQGYLPAIAKLSIDDCEKYENDLDRLRGQIRKHKETLIAERKKSEDEIRLCVVCVDTPKSVVLIPCRHLCVCAKCAGSQHLKLCPLCRERIVETMAVYL